MMDDIQKALMATFQAETRELLQELEAALLELESVPGDKELVDRVFRALHTIKGNGSMFGYDSISRFTHDLENVYDLVRKGSLEINKELIDLTLSAGDIIGEMVAKEEGEDEVLLQSANKLLKAFNQLFPDIVSLGDAADTAESVQVIEEKRATFRIRFKPDPEIFLSGTNPLALLRELERLGQTTVIPNLKETPPLSKLSPEKSYLSWDIILTTKEPREVVEDVFIFVQDRCELSIEAIDEEGSFDDDDSHIRLGDILIERGDLSREDLDSVLVKKIPLGEELVARNLVDDEVIEAALLEQQVIKEARSRRMEDEAASSVRVASDKLDSLIDLVGELVTVQARLTRSAERIDDAELTFISERVDLLVSELRDNAFSVRMIPIGTTFSSLKRTVRDLAAEMGREVELSTAGAETELDKTVIEKLRDPLVHLIRNSLDHGLETPEEREKVGKPRTGQIKLSASQAGADVLIQISDDGRGMNEPAIRQKAVAMGLVTDESAVTRKELFSLIFEPAFSTAEKVTSVSGRGVGMDVVKRSVDALRGSIEIDSRDGKGTEITIRLPLTLAIIEGLQVDIGGDKYIVPLSMVEECVELKREEKEAVKGRRLAAVRGDLVPYINMREWFSMKGSDREIEQIVITRKGDQKIGFLVDYVVGEHQTVIKSLGRAYRNTDGVSGATILGDGSVALILDIPRLVRVAERAADEE
jgi:two-component system chemotaxis sensor kinase CheA